MESRVGDLEKWQTLVDYRLTQGEKQFKDIQDTLHVQAERQNSLEKHVIAGNRDTAELKRSWESWLYDYKQDKIEHARASSMNRPKWWQVVLAGIATLITLGSLVVMLISSHTGVRA